MPVACSIVQSSRPKVRDQSNFLKIRKPSFIVVVDADSVEEVQF